MAQLCAHAAALGSVQGPRLPAPRRSATRRRPRPADSAASPADSGSYRSCEPASSISSTSSSSREQLGAFAFTLRAALAASALSAAVAAAPPPATAGSSWRPRRHHRRIDDGWFVPGNEAKAAAPAAKKAAVAPPPSAQQIAGDWQRSATQAYGRLRRAVQGDALYSVGVSGGSPPYAGAGARPRGSSLGWGALAIAGACVALLALGKRLPWLQPRPRPGGRWVRDRSLGGKQVFVPDSQADAAKGTRSVLDAARPQAAVRGLNDLPSVRLPVDETGAPAGAAPRARRPPDAKPEWWSPPPRSYVGPGRREELARQARAALRELEDAKLLAGRDYSLSGLVALRRLCQEGGGLTVQPATEAARDAMLRAAVGATLAAVQDGAVGGPGPEATLGGIEPARLVCGLAQDLGVPDDRAVAIAAGAVAATCRQLLIDAEAAYRARAGADVSACLLRLAATLQAFPLDPGSPQAELVAASITKQTSLEFRRAIFYAFGEQLGVPLAALVAELLGFDPELVVPQLLLHLQGLAAAAAGVPPPPPAGAAHPEAPA
eukprot:scaffold3.g6407.t1